MRCRARFCGSLPISRGGNAPGSSVLPGGASGTSGNDADGIPYGGGRADIRLSLGGDGEIYVSSKSDGMIRQMVAVGGLLATATVAATDSSATEAGLTTGTFAISRTGSTAAALTVNYTVSGSATPGSDYIALTGSVTIPAAAASAAITVTPIDDTTVEPDETVVVALTPNGAYLVGAPGNATAVWIAESEPRSCVRLRRGSGHDRRRLVRARQYGFGVRARVGRWPIWQGTVVRWDQRSGNGERLQLARPHRRDDTGSLGQTNNAQ